MGSKMMARWCRDSMALGPVAADTAAAADRFGMGCASDAVQADQA
jgi:hypothetical protein